MTFLSIKEVIIYGNSKYLLVVMLRLWAEIDKTQSYIDVYGSIHCPSKLKRVLDGVRQGFNAGLHPKLTEDGTSGAYRLRDSSKKDIAIFKALDEEPFAPNNPREHQGPFGSPTFRPGVLSGESCIREVAAYLLDHGGFSGVPPTTFVEIVHRSLKYVPFTGLEVTSEVYRDMMSTLIKPVNLEVPKPSKQLTNTRDSSSRSSILKDRSLTKKHALESQLGVKFGSLQQFCKAEGAVENYSSDLFSKD
jgi:hypothetical protein